MKSLPFALAALLAAPLATPAPAQDAPPALLVQHARILETPPMALSASGYFTIDNRGDAPDRLLAIEAPPYRAELHESVEQGDMHRMMPVESLEIPAHGSVELAPGGYHVMFLDLGDHRLLAGDTVPATLVFQSAGRIPVTFEVEKRAPGQSGATHGHAAP